MEKLIDILNKHNVAAFEVAEMIHSYLVNNGEMDDPLVKDLYKAFLKSE